MGVDEDDYSRFFKTEIWKHHIKYDIWLYKVYCTVASQSIYLLHTCQDDLLYVWCNMIVFTLIIHIAEEYNTDKAGKRAPQLNF